MKTSVTPLAVLLLLLATPPFTIPARAQDDACTQPEPVCAARAAVFVIAAFDPTASATRIGPNRLLTNRHTVADMESVTVHLPGGGWVTARPVPSDYPGDLLLLESEELPEGPVLELGETEPGMTVYTVAADVSDNAVRAYDPGPLRFEPADGHPLARLHHAAHSQPGNSGGALVDAEGRLVGIAASGGEGRFEAIPVSEIETLRARSGPEHGAAHEEIGAAVRVCTLMLDRLYNAGGKPMEDEVAKALQTSCGRSSNRQLFDLAGQSLGRAGRSEAAVEMFESSLAEDPNAVNSRIGLVVTYSLARRYGDSLPHAHWLLENEPDDLQVLRLAIQAGVWADDRPLAERALERLKVVNPQVVPAAEQFMNNPPPRP